MKDQTDTAESKQQESRVNRRDVMKAAGVSVVGIGAVAGTASAGNDADSLEYRFFGCSQVCVNQPDWWAIYVVNGECKKVRINTESNRGNLDWDSIYCYSGSQIVGIWKSGPGFIPNTSGPHNCAQNFDCPQYDLPWSES